MKLIAIVICLVVLAMLAFGCAGTTDKVADALNAFVDAHETIQKASDATNEICAIGTSNINDAKIVDKIDSICSDLHVLFLKYKSISDPIIDALKVEE
jgi:hypothetical protein